jgi:hypothetical protein
MIFAIKIEVDDQQAKSFSFIAQKTMYRQATNKIAGISDKAAAFLRGFISK